MNEETRLCLKDKSIDSLTWFNTKEAAKYLSVSENALRIMVHRDLVPTSKLGNRLRFKLRDLEAMMTQGENGNGN